MIRQDLSAKKQGMANPKAKLSDADVRTIRRRFDGGEPQNAIARDFPVHRTTVNQIGLRHLWSHIEE